MTSITAAQHTALLDALDALREKYLEACRRGDLKSEAYLDQQYRVVRDLVGNATIEAGDAQTPDAPPLWRDRDREDWMREGSIHLELVDAPYMAVAINPAWIESGTSLMVEDADEMVAILPEHLPALIAMLTEVQRRIEAGDAL